MFKLDLEKVGCGQKVEMSTIELAARLVGIDANADAGCHEIQGAEICSSIDRIGRMSDSASEFADVSILHAISDLVVVDAEPKAACVCIEFGPEFVTVEHIADFTSALRNSFKKLGIHLQNLHSVRSQYTYLTISVLGVKNSRKRLRPTHGSIFLSREIGAAKMMVLRQVEGDETKPFVDAIVSKRYLGGLRSNFCATDVTGFGLAGAAYNLCARLGARAQITMGREHLAHPDVMSVPVQCFEAKGLPKLGIEASCNRSAAIARCIEFAGPVLFFTQSENEADFVKEFNNKHDQEPLKVGSFAADTGNPVVRFNWEK